MAIGPDTWGPHGLDFVHYITLGYPQNPDDSTKKKYKNFFENLSHIIPCSLCADNYLNHLKIYPLNNNVLSNKMNFINWGIDMHNAVNKLNGKKVLGYKDGVKEIIKNLEFMYLKDEDDKDNNNSCVCPYPNASPKSLYIIIILSLIVFYLIYTKNTIN